MGAERTMVEGALAANAPLAIACWRGRSSLAVLVAKPECSLLEDKLSMAMSRCAPADMPICVGRACHATEG